MMMMSLVSVTELDHGQRYKLIILENLIEAFHV